MNTLDHVYLVSVMDNAHAYSAVQIERAAMTLLDGDRDGVITYLAEALHSQAIETESWRRKAEEEA